MQREFTILAARIFVPLASLQAADRSKLVPAGCNAAPTGDIVMPRGVKLFTDRDYTLTEAPAFLIGRRFLRTSIESYEIECTKPGEVFVMTLSKPHYANQRAALQRSATSYGRVS